MKSASYWACLVIAFIAISVSVFVWMLEPVPRHLPDWTFYSALVWQFLALIFLAFAFRDCQISFLLAAFSVCCVMRCVGVNGFWFDLIPVLVAALSLLLAFFIVVYCDLHQPLKGLGLSAVDWQFTFFRLYLGFNLINHSAEKLFSGPGPFHQDVSAFISLGVPDPASFVLLAGLCEFAGAISLGLGFLTRLGALGTSVYLLVATVLGHHFNIGYIWALPGGGWEYPMLWTVFTVSYAFTGAGPYSIDGWIKRRKVNLVCR
jgi:putative oxidoreductase